jgi:exopolysaccharide biosynthesis polyprenyl glycosylphosphotransferase
MLEEGSKLAQTAPAVEERRAPTSQPLQRRSIKRIALRVLADAMAASSGLFLASIIRFEVMTGQPASTVDYSLITLLATPVLIVLFWLYGLYEPRQVLGPINEFKQVFHGVIAGTVLIVLADSLLELEIARSWIFIAMGWLFVTVGGERLIVRKMLHFLRRRGGDVTRTIVLGANQEARTIARTLEREGWLGYHIVGFVDDSVPLGQDVIGQHEVIGPTSELKNLVTEKRATLVLVAASAFDAPKLNRLFWELQNVDVDLQITSGTLDLLASRVTVQSVAGVPLLYVRRTGMDRLQRTMKRTMDFVSSLVGLVLLMPFFAVIAAWIKRDSEGPVFFRQVRVGQEGRPFTVWKFRTMYKDAETRRSELEHLSEGPGLLFKLKDDPRVTRVGRFLRRYSIDELPQLFNVIRGEMSLVGPRPALPAEVEQYDDWVRNRLRVKPGVTGLWQVSGRTETTFSDYVRYDLFYIQNWSLSLDLWILWRTFRAVLSAEGAH